MNRDTNGLTPKQARFVEEYLVDLNATQAYLRAGYAENSSISAVTNNAIALLRTHRVVDAIAQRKNELAQRLGITQEHVLREYARIAFSDMRNYADWGPTGMTLKDAKTLTNDHAAAVAEVTETKSRAGTSLKFKLHDKVRALDKLAEYTGLVKSGLNLEIDADNVMIVLRQVLP